MQDYSQPRHGRRGVRARLPSAGNPAPKEVIVVPQPTPEGVALTRAPGHAAGDDFRPAMGEDELGTPCALRRGERKTRQTREFADALFEQGQKLADADGVDAVQFMERDMAVVEGEVVEPGRC